MARPTRALIDLAALRHNCALALALAPGASTLAVVKSNAYGHGAAAVARALQGQVQAFGVACVEEALELREAGVRAPVLLMEGVFEPAELDIAARENFWLMVENPRQLGWLRHYVVPGNLYVRLGRFEYWAKPFTGGVTAWRHRATGEVVALAEPDTRFDGAGYVDGVGGTFDERNGWTATLERTPTAVHGFPIRAPGQADARVRPVRRQEP